MFNLPKKGMLLTALVLLLVACQPPGSVQVNVSGLEGANPAVTLSGQDYQASLGDPPVFDRLSPGTYTLEALPVQANGFEYRPEPASQTIQVVAGQSTQVSIVYSAPAPDRVAAFIRSLPQGADEFCSRASGLLTAGLQLRGIGSSNTTSLQSSLMGDRTTLQVAEAISGLMTAGGYEVNLTTNFLVGTEVVFTDGQEIYYLMILDSGLFDEANAVCWYSIR